MTETVKPTPGPYEIRTGFLHTLNSKSAKVGILTADQMSTHHVDGHSYSVNADEAKSNLHLARDAFEVFEEAGLTPRQLLEQRDELVRWVAPIVDMLRSGESDSIREPWISKLEEAIAKCGKVGE